MRKKLLSIVLTLCLTAGLFPALAVPAFAADSDFGTDVTALDDPDFEIDGTTLIKYTGPGGSVTIPDGVLYIERDAFRGCETLTSVAIPDSVDSMGRSCFEGCTNLTEVTLSKNISVLPSSCFFGCTSLTDVVLPEGVTKLDGECFRGCTGLKKIVLPDSVTTLGNYAFWDCTSLTDVVLPKEGLTNILMGCFFGCTGLRSISIPDTVTELDISAFQDSGLTAIDLPDGLKTIGNKCFQGTAIEKLSIPASVTWIGNLASGESYNRIREVTFEGTDLSGLKATILSSVTVYVQPGTEIPDCLKGNIVRTAGETTPSYRLDIQGGSDGKVELEPFIIANGSVASRSIFVKNTGTETWSSLKFQTSTPNLCSVTGAAATIGSNSTSYFSFSPKADLKSGKYTASVTVTADGGHRADFEISFTVEAYTCISVEPKTLDFGSVVVDYAQPAAKTLTIKNTGDHVVNLGTNQLKNFTCTVGRAQLAAGQSTTVTIQPKAGLAIGKYKETLDFSCGQHNVSFTADLQFTVKGQPALSSNPAEMDFGTAKQGYTPQEMTVTITNTGAGPTILKTATLSSSDFEFRLKLYEGGYERGPGQSADLKVRPVSGLKDGTYTGTLDIDTSDEGVKLSIPLKFVVEGKNSISISPDRLDFGSVGENYTQPAAKTMTVKNTGSSSVTLQAPTSTNYVLGALSRTTLAAGEEATFTVQPKAGLKTGVYTERIVIKTDQNDSESVGIDFQVKKKGATFVDVKESNWFFDDVEYVYEKGLMNGMGGNRFDPNGTTTRGQIVTILYRLEGEPAVNGRSSFTDVGSGQYYANAVKWASDYQIVTGYTNGKFGPNDPITREQMAAILYRYASYKQYNVSARANLSKFKDAGSISSYALDAISWANSRELINGDTNTMINPRGSATRAQVAAILHRFCENIV